MTKLNIFISSFTFFSKSNNFSTGCSIYAIFSYSKIFYYFSFYLNIIFLRVSWVKEYIFYENPYIKIRLKLANPRKF